MRTPNILFSGLALLLLVGAAPDPEPASGRYKLTPVEGGTLVTETMTKQQPQYAPVRLIQSAVGVPDRGAHLRESMRATLDALAETLEPAHQV